MSLNKWREAEKRTVHEGSGPGMTRAMKQQEFLKQLREELPANLFNPVLGIPGTPAIFCFLAVRVKVDIRH